MKKKQQIRESAELDLAVLGPEGKVCAAEQQYLVIDHLLREVISQDRPQNRRIRRAVRACYERDADEADLVIGGCRPSDESFADGFGSTELSG